MTENQNEKLSALMDGEHTDDSLRELVENASHRERWFRYQLVSAMMRGDAKHGQPVDISAAVSAEIAREPAPVSEISWFASLRRKLMRAGWMRPAANVAVAASVAVVTVVAVQNFQQPEEVMNPAPQTRSTVTALETMPIGGVVNPVSFNTVHTPTEEPDLGVERSLLQSFMMDHQQQLQLSQQDQLLEGNAQSERETPRQPDND